MEVTVLISGATGKLGRGLINCLIKQHTPRYSVTCLVRGYPSPPLPKGVKLAQYNLPRIMPTNLLIGDNPIVVHLAAVTHACNPDEYYTVNTQGTRAMLELAQTLHAAFFLFVSSRAIDPTGGPYARSKLQAEELVKKSGLAYTILRLSETYRLNRTEGVDAVIGQVARGGIVFLPGDGQDTVAPLHRDDALAALMHYLCTEPTNSTITISGSRSYTLNQLVVACSAIFHTKPLIVRIPEVLVNVFAYFSCMLPTPFLYPDQMQRLKSPKGVATKATLSWLAPRSLEEGLRG